MTNLEKLLRYLVKENDYGELAAKTGVDETTVKKFTMDIFARIIPSNFNQMEGSHIDEPDLVAIVSNFNDLVKEDSLKQIITNAVRKYGIEVKDASALLMAVLPVIHKNIQVIASPQKAAEAKAEAKAEEKKEADKIFDNISSKANEEAKKDEVKETKAARKNLWKKRPMAKAKEDNGETEDEGEDKKLSTLEKICIYVVLGCLALLVVTFIIILVLM